MIQIKDLSKTFEASDGEFEALKNINIDIDKGDIFGIIGMSGAGKSTLVRCINMLERPTTGTVIVDGVDLGTLSKSALREKRREITMIFQSFNLLMQRTCLKNVCFPLELVGTPRAEARKKAMELLKIVGLDDKANSYPAQLSGGQQQRVAIARALATDPKVLLCDEATSALDPNTTNSILELIREINEKLNITVVIITHQMSVVESICKNVAIIDNGEVVEMGPVGEVFSRPKSKVTKRLVYPENESGGITSYSDNTKMLRVVYNGAVAASKPLIARLAMEKGIMCNIAYASTKSIDKKAYGSMILTIDGSDEDVKTAVDFFNSVPNISVQGVDLDD